jgi:molybdate transport system substrate-binding protein
VEALKRTLLAAKSSTLQSSTTAIYMKTTMFPRLGVWDEVRQKLSDRGAAAVARGEAGITLQPLSELIHAPGVEVVGNVPQEVQFTSVFSAAIVRGSQNIGAAKRLIAFLASPAPDAALKANGMDRVTPH